MKKILFLILTIFFINQNCFAQGNRYGSALSIYDANFNNQKIRFNYLQYKEEDEALTKAINNVQVSEHAPKKIYRLIRRSWNVPKPYTLSIQKIIDLIWSDPTGRKMLLALREDGMLIRIVPNNNRTVTMRDTQIITTYSYGGMAPNGSYTSSSTTVIIPVKHIDGFNNPNLPPDLRLYHLQSFLHEFGHAYMYIIDPNNKNSLEEEMGVSMLGYNIANRIITGKPLTREQSKKYGRECMISLMSDDHKNLPVFGFFYHRLRTQGIYLPYVEEYLDLPVMYKKLLDEGKVSPASTFSPYMDLINH